MTRRPVLLFAMTVLAAGAMTTHVEAQGREGHAARGGQAMERPRANGGHIPPAPARREGTREPERFPTGHVNDTPHVSNNHWYGHEPPNDARFHLARPFEHGRFQHFGPTFRYNMLRVDRTRHMFWFPGGMYFQIADWDWPFFSGWCWDCGSDFVVYEDADHAGWYLIYNVHLGQYVHATYMGT